MSTLGEDDSVQVVAHGDCTEVEVIDLERHLPNPARSRGTVRVSSAGGFVSACNRRGSPEATTVYADESTQSLVAVLDDDTSERPGWRSNRVELHLQRTEEWRHWYDHQGIGKQQEFARVIEIGEAEIVDPSPTRMLELAETFHASVDARFKTASRLRDGRTQIVWDENVEATAGEEGMLEIPSVFELSVTPYYGAQPARLNARLKYRIKSGDLAIGYELVRPGDVLRQSYADFVALTRVDLPGWTFIEGTPAGALQ